MSDDKWYSGKDVPETPYEMIPGSWTDLPFTRFLPPYDGDVLLELYVYLRVRIRANYPHGQVQTQVMREGKNDGAGPNDITVGRRNQTLQQMSSASPEFGRPIRELWVGACDPTIPLTWQVYLGPEFLVGFRSTLYAKAYRQIRPWQLS
jgi:hypothetical protein